MNWLSILISGLKALFQKQRVARELDEEIQSYREASEAHKVAAGKTFD